MVKTWVATMLIAYARGVWKSLFLCSTHEETESMAVCLRDAETVICDRSFFMDFVFVCGEAR